MPSTIILYNDTCSRWPLVTKALIGGEAPHYSELNVEDGTVHVSPYYVLVLGLVLMILFLVLG